MTVLGHFKKANLRADAYFSNMGAPSGLVHNVNGMKKSISTREGKEKTTETRFSALTKSYLFSRSQISMVTKIW